LSAICQLVAVLGLHPATASDEPGLHLGLERERYLRYDNTERAHTGRWTRGRTHVWSARLRLAR
jgi:hypothetical protein